MCDRCRITTEDLKEMGGFTKLEHRHMSGVIDWDLCSLCWLAFQNFMEE
jgi:hypothetical protein